MFYAQFLKITDIDLEKIEKFDYWLATLPILKQKNITVTGVASKLGLTYEEAIRILDYCDKEKIVKKQYDVHCSECDFSLGIFDNEEISELLLEDQYCPVCEKKVKIKADDIYVTYMLIKRPEATEEDIRAAIEGKMGDENTDKLNFSEADSINNHIYDLYTSFYNPDESAYEHFAELKEMLNKDYKNSTEKGNALEELALEVFNQIKGVSVTNKVRTSTNQFDCTCLNCVSTVYPSIFNYLSPYFIIECKNEKEKPGNNYLNKLVGIMNRNDSKLGIILSRKKAAKTCETIARENYLVSVGSSRKKVIIVMNDQDLEYLIDRRVNLLKYLHYKIIQVTTGDFNLKYEAFEDKL